MARPPIRPVFLDTARTIPLVVDAVADRWASPSALAGWTVGGLTGHLTRAVTTVGTYLEAGPPGGGTVIDPAGYFLTAGLDDEGVAADVLARGEAVGADGPAALAARVSEVVEELREQFDDVPEGRLVSVFGGSVLTLDDYLVTRLVELVVHHDDLVASVDVELPGLPRTAVDAALDALVAMARRRHGDAAVLRSLTRRERAPGTIAVF